MNLPTFSVRRSVTTGMVFVAIALVGIVALPRLAIDMFPDVELPTVSVVTYYIGASARDVDEKVTDVLEESLAVTQDLEEMSSISQENVSIITLQFAWGTSLDEVMNDVRTRLDFARRDLPDEAEDPLALRVNLSMMPIMDLAVTSSSGDVQAQSELVDDIIVNRLEQVDGVASIGVTNERRSQVLVDVDRERLEDYGISLQQIAQIIGMENLTLPAGDIDIGRRQFTVRVPGEFQTVDELRDVIVSQNMGNLVYLRDVADVREGLEESSSVALVDGHPAILLQVQRESGANTVDVAELVRARVDELNVQIPENLSITVLNDESRLIVMFIDNLTDAVWSGIVLVIIITFLLLRRLRTTLIVGLTIPTCLISVFAVLYLGGFTLNMVSMASMALSIGIVVDNSLVVIDNIVRHIEMGKGRAEAAMAGAGEVDGAIFASSLTNVVVFAPLIFVGGLLGVFLDLFAYIFTATMVMSLLVGLMLAPMLASRILRPRDVSSEGWLYKTLGKPVDALERAYAVIIRWSISSRSTVAIVIVGAVVSFIATMVTIGLVGQDFLPTAEGGNLGITAQLPTGTSVERTAEVARQIEQVIRDNVPEAQKTYFSVGRSARSLSLGGAANNIADVNAILPPLAERARTNAEIESSLRPHLEKIPGVVGLEVGGGGFSSISSAGGGRQLVVEIFAPDDGAARDAALLVRDIFERTGGCTDIASDLADEIPELRVNVDRARAARLGVPMASVAAAVRFAVAGHVVTRFRGGDADDEILLRLRPEHRDSVDDIASLTVPSLSGSQIRLDNIARITEEQSPVEIRRVGGNRTLRVMSNVQGRPMNEVHADLKRQIEQARANGALPPEVVTTFAGDVQEQQDMIRDLSLALGLAILLVYIVMAAQFESFLDPLVIMFSVPFGVTGCFLALLITGVTLQVTSFMGVIIIVGIVVNNAIVLIDYINEMRRQGMPLHDAVIQGGARRLRPILMTSLTTIGGTFPLAIATGEGVNIWRPMGIAVTGGLLFSLFVTLVLIPAVYMATERWRRVRGVHDRPAAEAGSTPATPADAAQAT
jgi:hydrophobic/amphiphilic exporter-1 (mainly G- bacteria), HAE1 family